MLVRSVKSTPYEDVCEWIGRNETTTTRIVGRPFGLCSWRRKSLVIWSIGLDWHQGHYAYVRTYRRICRCLFRCIWRRVGRTFPCITRDCGWLAAFAASDFENMIQFGSMYHLVFYSLARSGPTKQAPRISSWDWLRDRLPVWHTLLRIWFMESEKHQDQKSGFQRRKKGGPHGCSTPIFQPTCNGKYSLV